MTVNEMIEKLSKVPGNASVMSDSGWECDATDCSAMFYSEEDNIVVLTQIDTGKTIDYRQDSRFEEV